MEQNENTTAEKGESVAPKRRRVGRRAISATVPSSIPQTAPLVPPAVGDGEPEAAPAPRRRGRPRKNPLPEETAAATETKPETPAAEAEVAPAPRRRGRPRKNPLPEETAAATEVKAETAATGAAAETPAAEAEVAPAPRRRGRPRKNPLPEETAAATEAKAETAATGTAAATTAAGATGAAAETPAAEAEAAPAPRRRGRPRKNPLPETAAAADSSAASTEAAAAAVGKELAEAVAAAAAGAAGAAGSTAETAEGADAKTETKAAEAKSESRSESRADAKNDSRSRQRTRQRERNKRRTADEIEELTEDDVLLPVAGILDVLDNYAFVRTSGYLPGVSDIYVSLSQVKRHGLRKGDAVVGAIRQPRDGEGNGRQKYNALVKLDSVNGTAATEVQERVEFEKLTAVAVDTHVAVAENAGPIGRAIGALTPLALGQRGLVTANSPHLAAGVLREIGAAFAENSPETHLMYVQVGGRPELVTELSRSFSGEVIAAAADRSAEDQLTVVELAFERAKRLVELGHDVVVLLDSLTAYGDAITAVSPLQKGSIIGYEPATARALSTLLAQARNVENGGSLAIYAAVDQLSTANDREQERVANWLYTTDITAEGVCPEPGIDVISSFALNTAELVGEQAANAVRQLREAVQSGELDSIELNKQIAATKSVNAVLKLAN